MMAWFTAKGMLGLVRWGWLAIALLGIALLVLAVVNRISDTVDTITTTAERAGETRAVVAGQNQTLDQLGDAKNAEQDLRSSGQRSHARHEQCLLDSDRPAACERYNPDAQQ